jgi:CO/xanthine dehydrogenase FAD-binding subunit
MAIDRYLDAQTPVAGNGHRVGSSPLIKISTRALSQIPRVQTVYSSPSARSIETEDVRALDLVSVEEEASRCLNCACVAVNVSDLAPALVALDAKIRTTKRVIDAGKFFAFGIASTTVLDSEELVTELEIPIPEEQSVQRYRKFRIRHSIDFAIVSVASVLSLRDNQIRSAAVALGAVAPTPLRATDVERFLVGREPDAETAEAAGVIAAQTACPLPKNAFKVQVVRALLREAVLDLRRSRSDSPSSG